MAKKKNADEMLEIALELVLKYFSDKTDKGGHPYTEHLYTVRDKVKKYDKETQVIALLHDIIEDTDITEKELYEMGISKSIISSIKIVSRKKSESYGAFINRIVNSGDTRAINVKIADLTHNMDLSRIPNPTKVDYDRVAKYQKAMKTLTEGC